MAAGPTLPAAEYTGRIREPVASAPTRSQEGLSSSNPPLA